MVKSLKSQDESYIWSCEYQVPEDWDEGDLEENDLQILRSAARKYRPRTSTAPEPVLKKQEGPVLEPVDSGWIAEEERTAKRRNGKLTPIRKKGSSRPSYG
ncbi:hypothetical protein BS47DRAFT_1365630 [Hydnum rufescens UP504]|uniref:Uncharacterized protein n=1 Tax=Hydnum rufescens UP504 TaxID=1448309 RepID=A0A9P6ANB3_9AGAM|nr:hypothetical protein BS47DRAFT_1365630 [Hydnum rufescens UP504]